MIANVEEFYLAQAEQESRIEAYLELQPNCTGCMWLGAVELDEKPTQVNAACRRFATDPHCRFQFE